MATTWKITIDWDRDGNHTDPPDDVTAFIISAEWFLGMQGKRADGHASIPGAGKRLLLLTIQQ